MRVGITYDLKKSYIAAGYTEEQAAEFDSEETINAIADTLHQLGYQPVLIGNLFSLIKQLACNQTWDLVFNIAEGLTGRNRESQIPCILEAYRIPYTFSDPLTLSVSLDKAMSKRIWSTAAIPTPAFQVINQHEPLINIAALHLLKYPLFVKPLYEGTGKGITSSSFIANPQELEAAIRRVHTDFNQPALVEEYLPGQEYTVGITGTGMDARVLGVLEINYTQQQESAIYSYHNKKHYQEKVAYQLATEQPVIDQASQVALAAYRALDCRDAGRVDLRTDSQGKISVIEINPLAGLNPVDSDLPILCRLRGTSYQDLIKNIMDSARKRIPARKKSPSVSERPITGSSHENCHLL